MLWELAGSLQWLREGNQGFGMEIQGLKTLELTCSQDNDDRNVGISIYLHFAVWF